MRRHRQPIRRRTATLLVLAALFPLAAADAREVEIGVVAGGQQPGSIDTTTGSLDLAGGLLYGLTVGWRVKADGIVEIGWARQESEASGELRSGPQRFDVTIDTAEIGGLWETRLESMRPFLGLWIGATRLAGPGQGTGEGWNLSGAIGGGVRWFLGEHALLRLEGRLGGILFSDSTALACSSLPGSCSVGVSGSALGTLSTRVVLSTRF